MCSTPEGLFSSFSFGCWSCVHLSILLMQELCKFWCPTDVGEVLIYVCCHLCVLWIQIEISSVFPLVQKQQCRNSDHMRKCVSFCSTNAAAAGAVFIFVSHERSCYVVFMYVSYGFMSGSSTCPTDVGESFTFVHSENVHFLHSYVWMRYLVDWMSQIDETNPQLSMTIFSELCLLFSATDEVCQDISNSVSNVVRHILIPQ